MEKLPRINISVNKMEHQNLFFYLRIIIKLDSKYYEPVIKTNSIIFRNIIISKMATKTKLKMTHKTPQKHGEGVIYIYNICIICLYDI